MAILTAAILAATAAMMAQTQPAVQCFYPQEKDRLIQLSHEAVDEAFKEQVKGLFSVWVRDPAEQPKRAMSGMATNISAYHRARANIRQWEPVTCQ